MHAEDPRVCYMDITRISCVTYTDIVRNLRSATDLRVAEGLWIVTVAVDSPGRRKVIPGDLEIDDITHKGGSTWRKKALAALRP